MKKQFYESLENHFLQNLDGVSPLQKAIREKAWERFTMLGLPEKKVAGYQYFPFSQLYQETFSLPELPQIRKEQILPHLFPDCKQSHILFVNGQYVPELSDTSALPEEVVILRLRDALTTYGNFLQGRLSHTLKEETDPFATLNIALIQMGLFLYIPPHLILDRPIQCLNLTSNDHPTISNPRIHFFLGKGAKVQWIHDYQCLKDFEDFTNSVIDINLEEGAEFTRYGLLEPCEHGWCFEALRATLKKDSKLTSFTCTSGTKSVRQDMKVHLVGENASCDLKGVSALSHHNQSHVNIHIEHKAPLCHSNQLFKNILKDTSRSSFEGKIYVHPEAQKTLAYQLNNNLILDRRAVANSKPNLEIFADDVKASHGATVTQLNREHLHYLRTRGLSKEEGKKLLLSGFTLDLIESVSYLPMKEKFLQFTEKHLG